jgi:2-haloacid dehalogenase
MTDFRPTAIRVVACDIFGTVVDWRTGVADQVTEIARDRADLDAGSFTDAWRDRYRPALNRVNRRDRDWAYLDTLHRESLDELLAEYGVADAFDEPARQRLVLAWHRLPAWDDSVAGLARLGSRYVRATLSNGGFALLTHVVKSAGLPFDCILTAELAKIYKPAPEAYLTAARLLDVEPDEILLVAAHTSDIAGARNAGLRTAFLSRPLEKGPHRTADELGDTASDLAVTSFHELADALDC